MNFKLTKSSLNFKVYTSPTIPSSGTENDIVIISTTPMENWILSSDAPVGEPRNRGDVWIQYSVSGNVFDVMNQHDFMLAITKIYQYVGKTWTSVNARRYVGGVWDVVSSAFSATISITYPANSTCTVTNPSGQIVANDTNATSSPQTFTAIVGATGTYTVTATATDGSGNSKSETVEITAEGQSVSVELSYRYYIFQSGVGLTDGFTIAGKAYGGGVVGNWTPTITDQNIYTDRGDHGWFIKESIDMSKYSVLGARVLVKSIGSNGFSLRVNNAVQSNTAMVKYVATAAIDSGSVNTETVISLPLDGISDRSSLYLGWEMRNSENYVYDLYLA